MATPRPFTVDQTLTAIAIGWRNPEANLIADQVLPRVQVGGEKFKWQEWNLADGFTVPNTYVGRKGRPNQVELGSVERTDAVDDWALDDPIPNTDIDSAAQLRAANLSSYDPEARAVTGLTDYILLDREVRVANMVFNAANYDGARTVTLSGTSQFSDFTNSTPIEVINTGLDATIAFRPNTLVIGRQAWTKLRSHPHIVNGIVGGSTGRGMVSREQVASLFELSRVIVGDAFVNTAKKGQTASLARAWGKHIALLYLDANVDAGNRISYGFTAQYGTRISGRIADPNVGIQGGQALRVGERVKEVIAAKSVGYFIQNAVA